MITRSGPPRGPSPLPSHFVRTGTTMLPRPWGVTAGLLVCSRCNGQEMRLGRRNARFPNSSIRRLVCMRLCLDDVGIRRKNCHQRDKGGFRIDCPRLLSLKCFVMLTCPPCRGPGTDYRNSVTKPTNRAENGRAKAECLLQQRQVPGETSSAFSGGRGGLAFGRPGLIALSLESGITPGPSYTTHLAG